MQIANTGELPEVGPPIAFYGSDSYHLATLIATHDYVLYSNDIAWLKSVWTGYKDAMTFITGKINSGTGLLDVTGASGWGRAANGGGYSTIGNMLMYRALISGAVLANWAGETDLITGWQTLAATLKAAINRPENNWDPTVG